MKYCSRCKQEKDLSEFHKDRARKDGLDIWCKECNRTRTHTYTEKSAKKGFIYLIHAPEVNRFKIGFTSDVENRLFNLQGESPCELELIAYFPGTRFDERALHRIFSAFHVRREWFDGFALVQARMHFAQCIRATQVNPRIDVTGHEHERLSKEG